MRAFLTVGFLCTVLLAGCLGTDPGDDGDAMEGGAAGAYAMPTLRCIGAPPDACNPNMTPDPERQGNEVTIAVNPTDWRNIVGGAKDYYPPDAGECVWDGVYVTHDGGATYEDRSFDGSPWRALSDPASFRPNYASQYWCTTDPVAYFDVNGNFYYLLMAYQADRVTGSKTCEDICPRGALNDWAFNRAVQIVAVSDDGGDTFHTFTPVLEGSYPVSFHDKGWIAASADGTIHVMWLAGVAPGNLYFRSTDGGQTYTDPEVLAPVGMGAGQGSFVDVGPGAEVYASWYGAGGIQLRRSLDKGDTWEPVQTVHEYDQAPMPGISDRDRRTGYPALAVDRWPDSPHAGNVYLVWQGPSSNGASDTWFIASYDGGETWQEPKVISDDIHPADAAKEDPWQVFPTLSVSPGGVIDVSWMDTRLDAKGYRLDQYHTYSLDGGRTWAENFRVRDVDDGGWDPALSHHQNGMIFVGDYNDIDSSWGFAHPVWPDTRNGETVKVHTALIERPLFATGWATAGLPALRERLVADGLVPEDHPFLAMGPPAVDATGAVIGGWPGVAGPTA